MRLITGDECGLLKETIPEQCRPKPQKSQDLSKNKVQLSTLDGVHRIDPNESQRRARGIVDLAFTNPFQTSFAALRANGSVQLWESRQTSKEAFAKYTCTGVVSNVFDGGNDNDEDTPQQLPARPIALDSLVQQERLVAADSLGTISIIRATNSPSVVASYSPFNKQQQTLSYTKGSYTNQNVCSVMAVDTRGERVAIGGRERETRLLDIHTGDVVWKAKNLAPDPQTLLQHPIWSTALVFLNDNKHTMANGTAFSQVRLYDVRISSKQKRPIAYTPEGLLSHRVTALCQVSNHELAIGNAAGGLFCIDMRSIKSKPKYHLNLARFVGPVGSIRQVVKHPTLPILATVGLDRMLRTFDVNKRSQVDCIYMKQRLNAVLFCNDETWNTGEEDSASTRVVEDDGGDLNEEDQVQAYVDSSGEEDSSDEEGRGDDDSDEDRSDNDSSQESESESEDESDEEEAPPRHVSKKRRL